MLKMYVAVYNFVLVYALEILYRQLLKPEWVLTTYYIGTHTKIITMNALLSQVSRQNYHSQERVQSQAANEWL